MEGVTILNAYNSYSFAGALRLAGLIVGAVIFLIASIVLFDESTVASGICFGLMVVAIIGCFNIPKTKKIYEITVDDTVSWTELNEHYNIEQQRGKILQVSEK